MSATTGHSRHSFTCVCGRTVHGNGGIASHQRACRPYLSDRYVRRCIRLTTYPWNDNDAGMRHARLVLAAGAEHDRVELRRRGGLLTTEAAS